MYSKTLATLAAGLLVATIVLQLARGAVVQSATKTTGGNGDGGGGGGEPQGDLNDPEYWLKRKEWFYKRTRFSLTDDNLKLLGLKGRSGTENKSAQPVGHLPFWFDYELYKKVFNKPTAASEKDELERHHVYISTCVRVLKLRVLFRMLAGTSDTLITDDADKFYWEKFGPMGQGVRENSGSQADGDEDDEGSREIAMFANFKVEPQLRNESPIDRAIRLVNEEMKIVESKNQVETNLRSFNEVDGSALAGKLPY